MTFHRLPITILLLMAVVLLAGACQTEGPADSTEAGEDTAAEPASSASAITLEPLADSPRFPGATLTSLTPTNDTLEPGKVELQFAVENYELGVQTEDAADKGIANSGDGQHIHLIIDNGPYSAHYEPTAEIELDGGADGEGSHVMLAFLSRSYHESVKEPGAWVLREFLLGDAESTLDPTAPHMFYSRPKGTYSGPAAERIMVDFYLLNVDLSPSGNRVRLSVEGSEFLIDEWRPFVLEGLPDGEVTLTLELIDSDGQPVPGPFNQTTRTITVEREDA